MSSSRYSTSGSTVDHIMRAQVEPLLAGFNSERAIALNINQLKDLYNWIDEIPLSRPKRNISRDFADGVLMGELINYCLPRLVDSHNYSPANSKSQKKYNWNTLNKKVFHKIGMSVHPEDIEDIVVARPFVVERVIYALKFKADNLNMESTKQKPNIVVLSHMHKEKYNECKAIPYEGCGIEGISREESFMENKVEELRSENALLNERIDQLEKLLWIKDAKIESMSRQFCYKKTDPN